MTLLSDTSFQELEFIPLAIIDGLTAEEVVRNLPPENPLPASGQFPAIVSGDRFLKVTYPQRRELVQFILHVGTKLLLAGASKAGKTWLLLALAIAVATGKPWLGLPTKKSRVLFINLEILPDFFQQRCLMIKAKLGLHSLGSLRIWNLRGYEADIEVIVDQVLARIDEDGGYDLVVIDPVYKCYGERDENNAGDIANFLSHLERIATTGAAVAYSTHYSKGNQASRNVLDRTSGSGVFARDADTYVSITEHEQDLHFSAEFVVRNGPGVAPFVLRKEFPLFVRDDSVDPSKLKRTNRRAVSPSLGNAPANLGRKPKFTDEELLGLLPVTGLTYGEWEKLAKYGLHCSATTFKERRRSLLTSDLIKQEKGRYFANGQPSTAKSGSEQTV